MPKLTPRTRVRLKLFGALISVFLAFLAAYPLVGEVRTVLLVTLFFGAFAAGAGLSSAVAELRRRE
jgi:hypothetical protein